MRTLYFFLLFTSPLLAQHGNWTAENFERRILTYEPVQRIGVADDAYAHGKMILRETVLQTDNQVEHFNVGDYFNVLSALCSLREPDSLLRLALQKMVGAPDGCEYLDLLSNKINQNPKYAPIAFEWADRRHNCANAEVTETANHPLTAEVEPALLEALTAISERDRRHRKGGYNAALQTPLDEANQHSVDSLYALYGTYLGVDLVGNELGHTMWAVIQHSNPAMMKRYLPVIHAAVQEGRLPETPLRMLLDRYYGLTAGYQFFGSQSGFGFREATDSERAGVLPKYKLK